MSLSSPGPTAIAPSPPCCILLSLPPELKVNIYELVLLTPEDETLLQVTKAGYTRPALLKTCREVRSEALSIWYYNTKFHTLINDFNSTPLQRWAASFKSIGVHRSKAVMYSTPAWSPSCTNLLLWLRLYHAGTIHGRCPGAVHLLEQHSKRKIDLRWFAVGTMFDVAKTLRERPWGEVERLLLTTRHALIAADEKWRD